MKTNYLILAITILLSSFIHAENISKYMLFQAQKMELVENSQAFDMAQMAELENLIQQSIKNSSIGTKNLSIDNHCIQLDFQLDDALTKHDEFLLQINEYDIQITAKNEHALRYGKQTLLYLFEYVKSEQKPLPQLKIHDWANFERRGYMLDISRDKVPRMESLFALIDQLADWRFNELQLYTEHTFAYKNHHRVWENASPITAEEVQALDAYCLKKGIDLVPNQNSFGHMENWLKHDEYLDLCECVDTCKTAWGKLKRTALAPTNPNSLLFMKELYAELLPNFSSKYANIGGDETVELGLGKSKELCDEIGQGRVYLNFLKQLNEAIIENGKQTQFWGDIVLKYPEVIQDIPKNMIAMVWGYQDNHPFDKNLPKFQEQGLEFYVCPGTSSWRSEIGRNENAFLNLENAAIQGQKYGAKGYLITDWGDYGHFQPKSVSYPSLVLGANYAWNRSEESLENLEFLLNQYVFKDDSGYTAKALLTLGNAYLKADIPNGNANAFHLMLQRYKWSMSSQYQTKAITKKGLKAAKKEVQKGIKLLHKAQPKSYDAEIILTELEQAAELALFGVQLGLYRLKAKDMATVNISKKPKEKLIKELNSLIENHKEVWLIRNREGGLKDSAEKLENIVDFLQKE